VLYDGEYGVKQGGRHYIGLGHSFIEFKAQRFLLSFVDWPELGQPKMGELEEYWQEPWVLKHPPVKCRSGDGLLVSLSVAVSISLGVEDPEYLPPEGVDLPELSTVRKNSIVDLYLQFATKDEAQRNNFRGTWEDAIYVMTVSMVNDETSMWAASDFYLFRGEIQKSLEDRLKRAFLALHMTVHGVYITEIVLPPELSEAIQDTELARQEIEQATFEKRTRVVEAGTVKQVAKVYARMLNYTAYKTADADYLAKKVMADATIARVEERAKGLEYARARLNYTSNKEFLEYVHLMALMDAESEGLLFDNPVPFQLEEAYSPRAGTEKYPPPPTPSPTPEPTPPTPAPTAEPTASPTAAPTSARRLGADL